MLLISSSLQLLYVWASSSKSLRVSWYLFMQRLYPSIIILSCDMSRRHFKLIALARGSFTLVTDHTLAVHFLSLFEYPSRKYTVQIRSTHSYTVYKDFVVIHFFFITCYSNPIFTLLNAFACQ